jgi:hypothetical protein
VTPLILPVSVHGSAALLLLLLIIYAMSAGAVTLVWRGLSHPAAGPASGGLAEHGGEPPLEDRLAVVEAGAVGGHGCSVDFLRRVAQVGRLSDCRAAARRALVWSGTPRQAGRLNRGIRFSRVSPGTGKLFCPGLTSGSNYASAWSATARSGPPLTRPDQHNLSYPRLCLWARNAETAPEARELLHLAR